MLIGIDVLIFDIKHRRPLLYVSLNHAEFHEPPRKKESPSWSWTGRTPLSTGVEGTYPFGQSFFRLLCSSTHAAHPGRSPSWRRRLNLPALW